MTVQDMNKNDERFYVWWHCPHTQNRDMAGVAYYNERDGDYRIILNFFPDNNYFLKCVGGSEDSLRYRLISVKEKGGKGSRFTQGDGILNSKTDEIVIQVAPFSKLLVVNLRGKTTNEKSTQKMEVQK